MPNPQVEAKILAKVTKPKCDACDANAWEVSDEAHFLAIIRDGNRIVTDSGIPLYAAICTNCGFVRLFHKNIL